MCLKNIYLKISEESVHVDICGESDVAIHMSDHLEAINTKRMFILALQTFLQYNSIGHIKSNVYMQYILL